MQLFKNDDLKLWSTSFFLISFSSQQEKLNEILSRIGRDFFH